MASSSTAPTTPEKQNQTTGICKALFRSPEWKQDDVVGNKTQKSPVDPKTLKTLALMDKLHIEHGIETCYKEMEKDLLLQRLKNLREIAKKLPDDNWRYTSIEHLIGRD